MSEYDPISDNYRSYILGRPHIFILGAGATMAAIPEGDKYGNSCSVMKGFINNMGLRDILDGVKLQTKSENLEDIYSELHERPECNDVCELLEQRIIDKLSELQIPDSPTVYDYLLLSLRSKDYIFSFNWDDLIIQAYQRVYKITKDLPQLVFLHGNIGVGKCSKCGAVEAIRNRYCYKCGGVLERPKMLFPVKNKNYDSDPYIKNCWKGFLDILSHASIVSIFGYSAPQSDVLAIKAMEKAFSSTFRRLDQIEIIDIASESELINRWQNFSTPTNFHINIRKSLLEENSFIAEFPRRSIEGYYKRNFERGGWWGKSKISLNVGHTFDELKDILSPLIENETKGIYEVI